MFSLSSDAGKRKEFLIKFIEQVISVKAKKQKAEEKIEKVEKKFMPSAMEIGERRPLIIRPMVRPIAPPTLKPITKQIPTTPKPQVSQASAQMMPSILTAPPAPSVPSSTPALSTKTLTPLPVQPLQVPVPSQIKPLAPEPKINEKLDPLLADKSIKSMECSDGRLKTKRNGEEVAILQLSEEEISSIIKKFSEITKIPLIENIFKASFEDFNINAVISDLGSRFIIIRKPKQISEEEIPKPSKSILSA